MISLANSFRKGRGMTHGNTRHGSARRGKVTPTYRTWTSMIRRCTMPSQDSYPLYGGRGIIVCERWRTFENFLLDMGEKPSSRHSIDRLDRNGNYEPGNCRWAIEKEQQRNRSTNRLLTYKGQTLTVVEWSEITGIGSPAIRTRLDKHGWSVERALETPPRTRKQCMADALTARWAKKSV